MIHWTNALRTEVTPRTAEEAGPARARDEAFRALQKKRKKGRLNQYVTQFPSSAQLDAALALMDGAAWPDAPPPLEVGEQLLAISHMHSEGEEIFALLESHGSAYVFRVFVHATRAIDNSHITSTWQAAAIRLRSAILREPISNALVDEAWQGSNDERKLLLAIALPHRPELAAEVAKAMAGRTGFVPVHPLLMSLRDPVLATSLLSSAGAGWIPSFADVVATFGDDALPMILAYAPRARWKQQRRAVANALAVFDSEDVAALFVKWLPKKEVRVIATEWFARFPSIGDKALRAGSGRFAKKILEQRERAGETIDPSTEVGLDELPAILSNPPWKKRKRGDPKPAIAKPTRPPSLPAWWNPSLYHRPRTKDGQPLPLAACDEIGRMLKLSSLDLAWAGLDSVIDACDPHSLAEFAWDIAQAWELGGKKKTELWMLFSLAHLADEEVTRRTTPAITDVRIVDVLRTLGTDSAALELMTIAMRESSMKHWAEEALSDIAAERKLSKDELEDALTPTLGLDDEGAMSLDFGSAQHRVGFDTRLEPYVLSKNGDRLAHLPPRRKADDPEKVEEARRRWKDLKEDVTTIAARRLASATRAMESGRTWTLAELRRAWIEHPLLQHMARGILWTANDIVFRVCEDRTFADEEDRPVALDGDATIRVTDARKLGRSSIEKWRRIFDDYRILQPFDQLSVSE